jgi:hypothetical protein
VEAPAGALSATWLTREALGGGLGPTLEQLPLDNQELRDGVHCFLLYLVLSASCRLRSACG